MKGESRKLNPSIIYIYICFFCIYEYVRLPALLIGKCHLNLASLFSFLEGWMLLLNLILYVLELLRLFYRVVKGGFQGEGVP